MKHVPLARRFGVWGDDLMGYGKPKPKWQWWMDLEKVNGELQVLKLRDKGNVLENWLEEPDEEK